MLDILLFVELKVRNILELKLDFRVTHHGSEHIHDEMEDLQWVKGALCKV